MFSSKYSGFPHAQNEAWWQPPLVTCCESYWYKSKKWFYRILTVEITSNRPQSDKANPASSQSTYNSRIGLNLFCFPESRTLFRLNPGSRRTPSRPCFLTAQAWRNERLWKVPFEDRFWLASKTKKITEMTNTKDFSGVRWVVHLKARHAKFNRKSDIFKSELSRVVRFHRRSRGVRGEGGRDEDAGYDGGEKSFSRPRYAYVVTRSSMPTTSLLFWSGKKLKTFNLLSVLQSHCAVALSTQTEWSLDDIDNRESRRIPEFPVVKEYHPQRPHVTMDRSFVFEISNRTQQLIN